MKREEVYKHWDLQHERLALLRFLRALHLCRAAEYLVAPADTRANFVVLRLGMARGIKVGLENDTHIALAWYISTQC